MQKLNKNFKSSLHFQHGNVTLKFICLSLVITLKLLILLEMTKRYRGRPEQRKISQLLIHSPDVLKWLRQVYREEKADLRGR